MVVMSETDGVEVVKTDGTTVDLVVVVVVDVLYVTG